MTKNDLINDVAYELDGFLSKEQIDGMKITLYVKLQNFELVESKQLPVVVDHDNEWLMQRYCVDGVAAGRHKSTLRSYIGVIRKFFDHVGKNYKAVTAQDITDYLAIRSYGTISVTIINPQYTGIYALFLVGHLKRDISRTILSMEWNKVKQIKKKKVQPH